MAQRQSQHIYWPKTGITRDNGLVLGLRVEDVIVVVGIVEEWMDDRARLYPELSTIGSATGSSSAVEPIGSISFVLKNREPVQVSPSAQIILFDPPDPRRLRYMTLKNTAYREEGQSSDLARQDDYGIGSKRAHTVGLEAIIPLLNDVQCIQRALEKDDRGGQAEVERLPDLNITLYLPVLLASVAYILHTPRWTSETISCIGRYSSTIHQLSLRSGQLLSGPGDFRQTLHDPSVPLHIRSRKYVKFWNTVWLILNDLVLGYCAAELIGQSAPVICAYLPDVFHLYTVDYVSSALNWLDDWPVGLKLNTPLSRFFCLGFRSIVRWWGATVYPILQTYLGRWLRVMAWSGYGGLTLFLALGRDSLTVVTLHLRLCHQITSLLVKWQLSSLSGLWNLFRGKKWNVLRQRSDSYAYDVDQLFLGTLLFTVSAFLLPTVLTYAALFASIQTVLWGVSKFLEVITDGLNAFPLFEVLLRIKEPSRLPHGVIFKLRSGTGGTSVLELRNAPKSFMSILGFERVKKET